VRDSVQRCDSPVTTDPKSLYFKEPEAAPVQLGSSCVQQLLII